MVRPFLREILLGESNDVVDDKQMGDEEEDGTSENADDGSTTTDKASPTSNVIAEHTRGRSRHRNESDPMIAHVFWNVPPRLWLVLALAVFEGSNSKVDRSIAQRRFAIDAHREG